MSCGIWNEQNNLSQRIALELKPLRESGNFCEVKFNPYDAERIITAYKELKKKVTRTFTMEKKIVFPETEGVKQSFLGLVSCKDFVSLLRDSDGNMLTNIFEDNVRDFQGYNTVNTEIANTILISISCFLDDFFILNCNYCFKMRVAFLEDFLLVLIREK